MFDRLSPKLFTHPTIAALLICGTVLGAGAVSSTGSSAGSVSAIPVTFTVEAAPQPNAEDNGATEAAVKFVEYLTSKRPDVWQFAPEDDQQDMASDQDAVGVFTQAYPPLANAADVSVDRVATTGETKTVEIYVKDKAGLEWLASMSLLQDDAGDWKLMNCDIQPAPDNMV